MRQCSKCGAEYDGAEQFCPVDGTRLASTVELRAIQEEPAEAPDQYIGKVIQGRYKVLKRLGEGGMGVVYIAEHVEIEKKVALKVLRDDFSKRPEVVERFRQEARSASKIGHPHIVDVTDFGQLEDGGVYFVMEYLVGCGLCDIVRGEPVPLIRAVPIIDQIARALKAAHDMGIVHRDLKPENVFLIRREEQQDFVKILDFGIAKISDRDSEGKRLTKTGMIFGTPEYMSPEQAAGRSLDHRVDVYALGCIMFEMFTGSVPYDGDSFMAVLTQHMFEAIPAIEERNPQTDVPESVRAVVYKAMAKDPDSRYQDMDAVRSDLERALRDASYVVDHPGRDGTVRFSKEGSTGSPKQSRTTFDWTPATANHQDGKRPKARIVPVILALVATLLVAGGVAGWTQGWFGGRPVEQPVVVPPLVEAPVQRPAEPVDPVPPEAPPEQPEQAVNGTPVPAPIQVKITSEPPGAIVLIEGMGQVCSAAPCELDLAAGTPVKITARTADDRSATMTFTPSDQNRELHLELKAKVVQKSGGRKPAGGDKPAGGNKPAGDKPGDGSQKTPGGLKIPDLFKDN